MFGGSPGGMPDMSNVLQAALQNPAMLQGMMANPMVQQMMQSNPMMAAQAQVSSQANILFLVLLMTNTYLILKK